VNTIKWGKPAKLYYCSDNAADNCSTEEAATVLNSVLDQLDNNEMMWLFQAQATVRQEFNQKLELRNPNLMEEILEFALESKDDKLSKLYSKIKAATRSYN